MPTWAIVLATNVVVSLSTAAITSLIKDRQFDKRLSLIEWRLGVIEEQTKNGT